MLLTRKATSAAVSQRARLSRGLPGAPAKTIDRRGFLKRSGLTVGAGAVASQLPFNMIGNAEAQRGDAKKVEETSKQALDAKIDKVEDFVSVSRAKLKVIDALLSTESN